MKFALRPLLAGCVLFALSPASPAAIVITFSGNVLSDAVGTPIQDSGATHTLVQLVNLGADGAFNPINLNDGDASNLGQWVSGDDTLITAAYLNSGDATGDYSAAAAFDLAVGDSTAGQLVRFMKFSTGAIPAGTKLGIRWFPNINAANFSTTTLTVGQTYGQFTRQSNPLDQDVWVAPADGSQADFDPLVSTDSSPTPGPDNGHASLVVVPEPAALALAFLGAAGLFGLRRRRY